MPLWEAKSQVRQFLAGRYSLNLEDILAAPPEEMKSINMLASDWEGEADWDLANLTGGPDIGSQPSICSAYGHLRGMCSVVSESVSSSIAYLLLLAVHDLEEMSRTSIL